MRNISELGLEITLQLLEQINNDNTEVSNSFYQTYFLHLLQDLFYILTDTFHKSGEVLFAGVIFSLGRFFFTFLLSLLIPRIQEASAMPYCDVLDGGKPKNFRAFGSRPKR